MSRADLAEANYLNAKAGVQPGQRLVVPRAPSAALLAGRSTSTPVQLASIETETRESDVAGTVYRVRKGDTLYAIARRHGVSVENLRAWNQIKGSALSIGDRLQIHNGRSANAQ